MIDWQHPAQLNRNCRLIKCRHRQNFGSDIVLEALLEKYADEGIETIESPGILKVQPLDKFGTPVEIVRLFGGTDKYQTALKELESVLYTLIK